MAKTKSKRTAKPSKRVTKKAKAKPTKAKPRKPAKRVSVKGYYVLAYYTPLKGTQERAVLAQVKDPQDPFRTWWSGRPFDSSPRVPIRLVVGSEGGLLIPEYSEVPVPFMSARLQAVLMHAGVTNLQIYEVEIRDPASQLVWRDHVAFNVTDKLKLADLSTTKPLLTRLDEGTSGSMVIVVHDTVKRAIEAAGIGMAFHAEHAALGT